jgi:hypothetical protein
MPAAGERDAVMRVLDAIDHLRQLRLQLRNGSVSDMSMILIIHDWLHVRAGAIPPACRALRRPKRSCPMARR